MSKKYIKRFIILFTVLFTMSVGFFWLFALAWVECGLPVNLWTTVVLTLLACTAVFLFLIWAEGD